MNKKTLTAILCVLILSMTVVGMRLFVSNKKQETKVTETINSSTELSSKIEAESTIIEETTDEIIITTTTSENITLKTKEKQTTKRTTKANSTTNTKPTPTVSKTTMTVKETKKITETTAYTGVVTGFENDMLKRVNSLRNDYGTNSVTIDSNLNKVARIRAEEISKSYRSNHSRPDGSDWSTALDKLDGTSLENWTSAGENIAYGQLDVNEIMEAFEASSTHLKNIVTPHYTHCGFGCYSKQGVLYWVQIFVGV